MFKNYFIIALRNLLRHKSYSFINIAGLAIGMAAGVVCCFEMAAEFCLPHQHGSAAIAGRECAGTCDCRSHCAQPIVARRTHQSGAGVAV